MSENIVKPLNWKSYGNQHLHGWQGTGSMGYLHYIVDRGTDGERYGWFSILGNFDTIEDAKTAAYADYEARILSALSPSYASLQAENEALRRVNAAAPAMLEALKHAEQLHLNGILFTSPEDIQRVHDLRRAALAKVKGDVLP